MKKTKYDKLIRDKIPEIIEKSGKKTIIEVLDDHTFKQYLDDKLSEELQEYLASDNVEELADLIEVVYAILKHKKVSLADFDNIRMKKVVERGAFDKKLRLKEVIENI